MPPKRHDGSRFEAARLLDDGHTGVFTFTRSVYIERSRYPDLLFGGIRRVYLTNEVIIGSYDLNTKDARVLYHAPQSAGHDDRSALRILSHARKKVLLYGEKFAECALPEGGPYYLFDVNSQELRALPLEQESAERGVWTCQAPLAVGDGALLIQAIALGDRGKRWMWDDTISKQLWVRHADGEYVRLADARSWYGNHNDEVLYWSPERRGLLAYDTGSRRTREVQQSERSGLTKEREAPRVIDISIGDGKTLTLDRLQPDGTWRHEPIVLDPRKLKAAR